MINKIKSLTFFHWILIVFIIAFLFRFYKLTTYPVSFSMDEVNIGYNAYSILETGKDEWGIRMPLTFKSVGDYKPPVNVYLTSISIAIFGLSEFAVRFPVALFGSLSAVVFAYLLKELGLKKYESIIGGLWLAILPWHIHFSRASFEAVTALFLVILATYYFYKSIHNKSYLCLALSIIAFSLSVWAYHAERAFVPFFFIFLVLINLSNLKFVLKDRNKLLQIFMISLIFILPFLYLTFFTPAVESRALSTSVFRETSLARALHNGEYNSFGERIFDNDIFIVFRHIGGKYLNYFDLRFWYYRGLGYTPDGYPGMGLMYFVNLPVLFVGFYKLVFHKNKNLKNLFLLWFFLGPLPAAFTMNEQHALRSLVWLPAFGMAIAVGAVEIIKFIKKYKYKNYIYLIYSLLLIVNIVYFSDMYFRQFGRFFSEYWQYGYKQIALYACENRDKYEHIVITDTFGSDGPLNTGIPYNYVLFYCKIPPKDFIGGKRADGINIYNFIFRRVNWKNDKIEFENSLMIGSPWDFYPVEDLPQDQIIKEIKFLNNMRGFIFVEV